MNRCQFSVVMALGLVTIYNSAAYGQMIFQHNGNTDPLSQGWSQFGPFTGGVTAGPVTNDLGLGINAWNVSDNNTRDGSYLSYRGVPTATQVDQAQTFGWRLSASLRVVNTPDGVDYSVGISYIANNRIFSLIIGSNASGDPLVRLVTGTSGNATFGDTLTLTGLGSGYHTYEILSLAGGNSASLHVNGQLVATGYSGFSFISSPYVEWGSSQSSTTGEANFRSVQFSTVPEPSSLILVSLTGIALLVYRPRSKTESVTTELALE